MERSEQLITEHEAAELLAMPVQTLRNWRWQRKGPPYYKLGERNVRYQRAELEIFIKAGRRVARPRS